MHSTRMKTSSMALAVLCTLFVLMLGAPKAATADSCVQTVETSQEVSGVCPEQRRLTFVSQPLGAYLVIVDQRVPEPDAVYGLQPEETVCTELRVPAVLLRTLWTEEESNRTLELHVPAALLTTLSTEDWVQIPRRSPEPWEQFYSLY